MDSASCVSTDSVQAGSRAEIDAVVATAREQAAAAVPRIDLELDAVCVDLEHDRPPVHEGLQRIAEGTVYNKVNAGEIPFRRLGRTVRFRKSELDRWIVERDAESAASQKNAADVFAVKARIRRFAARSVEAVPSDGVSCSNRSGGSSWAFCSCRICWCASSSVAAAIRPS